ncbi:MAG: prenyltransferase [Nitrospira sp.]|nr:prenyltransferase [Nitrospira sp.]MDH4357085.1 prenyltransferase [Nitrospira sp.]MDH5317370.1 prenyltransferase [Nitrospira sp.]
MSDLRNLLGPMRLRFIILTPVCVLLGLATAVWTSGRVDTFHSVLALIGAVSAHTSVNVLNEYFDFKSGLDSMTRRTPFSGGSGTLPANPKLARQAFSTGLITFLITILIGAYFLSLRGLSLLPIGVLGLLIIISYTTWISRHPILCLIAPGIGFGLLMVMGTNFVLTGGYTWTAFIASLIPFFLVSDLLLLNQFPDVEADQTVGRRHLPIVLGRRASSIIYGVFLLAAYLTIIFGVWFEYLPKASLLGLGSVLISAPAFWGAFLHAENVSKLIPFMGLNVIINIMTPVLVAIGLLLGES